MHEIRQMLPADVRAVRELWVTSGIALGDSDSAEGMALFLQRNAGHSFVAMDDGDLVGAILGGHDGRLGYIHHVAVIASHQRRGIGAALVDRVVQTLRGVAIPMSHVLVSREPSSAEFWTALGWVCRDELRVVASRHQP
jgi:GNAT superfamily N-acetyltransferase